MSTAGKPKPKNQKKSFASTVSNESFSFFISVGEDGDVQVGILKTKGTEAGSNGPTLSSLTLSQEDAETVGSTLVKAAKVADRDGKATAFAGLDASVAESLGKVLKSAALAKMKKK